MFHCKSLKKSKLQGTDRAIRMMKRAKDRYERKLAGPYESRWKSRGVVLESHLLTCLKTSPYDEVVCFFCDEKLGYRQTLHSLRTFSAGESLPAAVNYQATTSSL